MHQSFPFLPSSVDAWASPSELAGKARDRQEHPAHLSPDQWRGALGDVLWCSSSLQAEEHVPSTPQAPLGTEWADQWAGVCARIRVT